MVGSVAGDHNDVQLIGRVLSVHVVRQQITALLLRIKAADDDPCVIAITPVHPLPRNFTQRGDRLWVRGRLACDPGPERKSMHFIEALHLEAVRRAAKPASATMATNERRTDVQTLDPKTNHRHSIAVTQSMSRGG
jgi:hypothetical protein